jgi:hypothetical protein
MGDGDHGRLVDDANRVPSEQRVTQRRPIDPGWNLYIKLAGQPRNRSISTQADAMVLIRVGLESDAKPP